MQAPNLDELLKANESFYRAFQDLDIRQMEAVWRRAAYIQCFHPGWGLLRGWEAVMSSWRRIFENAQGINIVLTEVHAEIRGTVGWVTQYENLTSEIDGERSYGVVLATNLFEKDSARWFMIHHHGSTVVNPPVPPGSRTVH
ncbi:MAG TPA: nuclear transport factor 2 family protein [Candidatus Acidoferrales bacterium]|nr:nuclear transport factor 2 family protein [Candidatus Acidoferrales bacterium]